MAEADLGGVDAVAAAAFAQRLPGDREDERVARQIARFGHLLRTDPTGCWVAERDGEVVGAAVAILREGLWGLSLFVVAEGLRSEGLGRRLLERALTYGRGSRGGLILSSPDPRAMRRYARAGFALRPCVSAAGIVDRSFVHDDAGVDEPGRDAALALATDLSRHARGASHGDDLAIFLDHGARMLCVGERGYVVHRQGSVLVLAARDEDAARTLLRAALAQGPPGATLHVDFMAAGHDWAVQTCLDAGMALSPDGPIFTRGEVGRMAPYLPSGAFL